MDIMEKKENQKLYQPITENDMLLSATTITITLKSLISYSLLQIAFSQKNVSDLSTSWVKNGNWFELMNSR